MAVDLDVLLSELTLLGPASSAQLVEAIAAPPELSRTVDGATTLTVDVRDSRRTLLRSGLFDSRSWAVVDGLHFELVKVRKAADTISLTFEDAVVAALRRRTDPRTFDADTATRQQIAGLLAGEAMVRIAVDPQSRPPVMAAVERSADGQEPSSSWEVLGTLAEEAGWRRFSDGVQLLFGSDDWLMSRLPPVALREHADAAGDIDFDLDVGQAASRATVAVDTTRWSIPPGQAVDLLEHGPASGRWLVETFTRRLTRTAGTVDLVRGQPTLDEVPPEDAEDGDPGEDDFLPDVPTSGGGRYMDAAERMARANGRDTTPGAGVQRMGLGDFRSAPRDRMLAYALAQRGKRYVLGGKGPTTFDCSGLVQEATRAGGKVLGAPVTSQWDRCKQEGKTISVEQAIRTRGALLFRYVGPGGGGGNGNHVAISLGDGTTMEARGTAYGVNVFDRANKQAFTGGAVWL